LRIPPRAAIIAAPARSYPASAAFASPVEPEPEGADRTANPAAQGGCRMNDAQQIDDLIAAIPDWRGTTFAKVRATILAADPQIIEEFKWMGSPLWSRDGMIAVGNAFKNKVNVTFAYGARLPDPEGLFNSGFGGNTRRAIDFFEGDPVNEPALTDLVRAAIAYNQAHLKKNLPNAAKAAARARAKA
jgi:hypothetical protein